MKKIFKIVLMCVSALILMSACTNSSNKSVKETKGTASEKQEKIKEQNTNENESETFNEEPEKEDTSNLVTERAEYTSDFSEEWNGLVTKIYKVVLAELTDEEQEELNADSKYIVQVYLNIQNNGDKDISTFPDQGTLVIQGQQVDASLFSTDLGGEIMKGVTKDDFVTFFVPKLENMAQINEIRLKWNSHFDSDDYNEDDFKEHDVTLQLSKV